MKRSAVIQQAMELILFSEMGGKWGALDPYADTYNALMELRDKFIDDEDPNYGRDELRNGKD